MTDDFHLSAETRTRLGTTEAVRLRGRGRIPANLYGLKKDTVALSVSADDVEKLVAKGSRVVDVELGGNVEKAVVQELQWDTFSTHVQHLDLKRVNPDGVATTDVPVELRGEPDGLKEGGELRLLSKTVRITCPDFRIPRNIVARVGALNLGDVVRAGDLKIPETATLETPPDTVVVEFFNPRKAVAEAAAE
ncbi:MAG: 50S ribosomal protein L25 [Planctomycetaceae bacterium]